MLQDTPPVHDCPSRLCFPAEYRAPVPGRHRPGAYQLSRGESRYLAGLLQHAGRNYAGTRLWPDRYAAGDKEIG